MKLDAVDYLKPFSRRFRAVLDRVMRKKGIAHAGGAAPPGDRRDDPRARKDKDLTLRQLSNRTKLSVSLLSQIERAESSASISSLYKIATALNSNPGPLRGLLTASRPGRRGRGARRGVGGSADPPCASGREPSARDRCRRREPRRSPRRLRPPPFLTTCRDNAGPRGRRCTPRCAPCVSDYLARREGRRTDGASCNEADVRRRRKPPRAQPHDPITGRRASLTARTHGELLERVAQWRRVGHELATGLIDAGEAAERLEAIRRGRAVRSEALLLRDAWDTWVGTLADPETQRRARSVWAKRIAPWFGSSPVVGLTDGRLMAWVAHSAIADTSPSDLGAVRLAYEMRRIRRRGSPSGRYRHA